MQNVTKDQCAESRQLFRKTMVQCRHIRNNGVCRSVLLVLLGVQLLGLVANMFWASGGGSLLLSTGLHSSSYRNNVRRFYANLSDLNTRDLMSARRPVYRVVHRPQAIKRMFKKQPKRYVWISPKITKRVEIFVKAFQERGYSMVEHFKDGWRLWWTVSDAFQDDSDELQNLRPNQKVNHIPGAKRLYKKADLITSNLTVIKPAFRLPEEKARFSTYVQTHPKTVWVRKNRRHRGIRVVDPNHILTEDAPSVIQEYIYNPFLIDNTKFDVGVFLLVTSASPLKMYIYRNDWLVKFCSKPYEPFNPLDLDKYVEGEIALKTEHMPSLKHLVNLGFTSKQCIKTYLREKGLNAEKVEDDILTAATEVGVAKDMQISHETKLWNLTSSTNFFELLRYDFLLDTNLRPWVIELNLSPDLTVRNDKSRVASMFRGMAESVLTMAGLDNPDLSDHERRKSVSDAEISIHSNLCNRSDCQQNCKLWMCRPCTHCLTSRDRDVLRQTVLEEKRRGSWHRVVPPRFKDQATARGWNPMDDPLYHKMSPQTQFLNSWFYHKCLADPWWC